MISSDALKELGEDEFIKMMRFVDWLWYSDEGLTLTKWGKEGETYTVTDGTYSLTPGASYSYTTTCAGYIGQTVEHYTAPDKDGTLTITLKKAPANDKLINFDSAWPHLRQNNENNGVVDYKTPVYAKDAELYWAPPLDPATM